MSRMYKSPASLLAVSLAITASGQGPTTSLATRAVDAPAGTVSSAMPAVSKSEDLASTPTVSQVRIVRLSEIRGTAKLDRDTGRGFEPAFANIPITEHSKLRTEAGLAEVEFEDNSTLRLTPDTEVEFSELGRAANGATVTRCKVVKGIVYVTLVKAKSADFTLVAGQSVLRPNAGSHLRLNMSTPLATLAVMDGAVDFTGATGSTVVAKKSTLSFGAAANAAPQLDAANKIQETQYDAWDKQGNAYQSRYANASFAGGTGMTFGTSDMNYYGGFADRGCGPMWRPYFANSAWDPYGAGTWAQYPGAGYSYVSPYPWGWTPYHSGSWAQCGGAGWGWVPNGQFYGLNNLTAANVAGTNPRNPHAPLKPPVGHASFVNVGTRPVETSALTRPDTFTFRQNSAGLGVPREVFGHLGHTSANVERHGSVNTDAGIGFLSAPQTTRVSSGVSSSLAASRSISFVTRPSSSVNSFVSPTYSGLSNSGSFGPGTGTTSSRTSSSSSSVSSSHSTSSGVGGGGGSAPGGGGGHK